MLLLGTGFGVGVGVAAAVVFVLAIENKEGDDDKMLKSVVGVEIAVTPDVADFTFGDARPGGDTRLDEALLLLLALLVEEDDEVVEEAGATAVEK